MPKVLFIITSDPRTSARPAEAIRIAAGVAVWKQIELTVYLKGPAVLALSGEVESLLDAENYGLYLPILRDLGRPIYVENGASGLEDSGTRAAVCPIKFECIDDAQLAAMAAASSHILRF